MGLFKKKSFSEFEAKVEAMKVQAEKQKQFDLENTDMCYQGMQAQKEGNIEQAISIYEKLLDRNFDGTHPYKELCIIYDKQKRYEDEIRVIKQLKKVTPKDRYKEGNKYRWYDERLKKLTSKE